MRTVLRTLLLCLLAPASIASAQDNPLSTHNRMLYGGVEKILLRSAELMPEEKYAFKPTAAVRSYGAILGHIADSQYAFCSAALGETNPAPKIEKTKSSKADLIAALKEAVAYCDKAYDGMTDKSGTEMVKFMGGDTPKLGVLAVNNVHTIEHYGNLVTYLRMNDIVPPTSDKEFVSQIKK